MRTPEENIRQLLEMLDHPDAYSEQEIQDIINRDEDTREAYRLMVEAKRSSRHRQHQRPVDVDAAWQELNQRLRADDETSGMKLQPGQQQDAGRARILSMAKRQSRVAASFVGVLLVSGIAFAAIHIVRNTGGSVESPAQEAQVSSQPHPVAPADTLTTDTTTVQPVTFDNVPLDQMLTEIAAYHQTEAVFKSDEARSLRFYFVWYKEQPLSKVVETLNRFERVDIEISDKKLIVR